LKLKASNFYYTVHILKSKFPQLSHTEKRSTCLAASNKFSFAVIAAAAMADAVGIDDDGAIGI